MWPLSDIPWMEWEILQSHHIEFSDPQQCRCRHLWITKQVSLIKEYLTWESLKAASLQRSGRRAQSPGTEEPLTIEQVWAISVRTLEALRSNSRTHNSVLPPLDEGCRTVPTSALWTPWRFQQGYSKSLINETGSISSNYM